jgi:integrase
VRHDAIPANPVRETDTITRAKGEIHVLDNDGLAELRAILDRWQRGLNKHTGEVEYTTRPRADDILDVVDLLIATGARIGELMALRWTDVHLADPDDGGQSTVTQAESHRTGTNGRGQGSGRSPEG